MTRQPGRAVHIVYPIMIYDIANRKFKISLYKSYT